MDSDNNLWTTIREIKEIVGPVEVYNVESFPGEGSIFSIHLPENRHQKTALPDYQAGQADK